MALSLSIVNNFPSIVAQNNLNKSSVALQTSLERLSSGLKINRGADGPAALVVSERLRTRTASLQQIIQNSEKDAAVIQIAEGGLDNVNALLTKARQLALDSANTATQDAATFAANQAELDSILDSIDRAAANTRFGTKGLLNGESGLRGIVSDTDVTFLRGTIGTTQAGQFAVTVTTAGQRSILEAPVAQTATLAVDEVLTVNGIAIQLNAGMSRFNVFDTINAFTSQTGAVVGESPNPTGVAMLTSIEFGATQTMSVVSNVAAAANSSGFGNVFVSDPGIDVVGTINGVTYTGRGNVLTANTGTGTPQLGMSVRFAPQSGANSHSTVSGAQGNVAVTDNTLIFQVGADTGQTDRLTVDKLDTGALGLDEFSSGNPSPAVQQFVNLSQIRITSLARANDAIKMIDDAIDKVTILRGRLGAIQRNSLELNIDNLRTQIQNQVAADSVIRDTDYAFEISQFTKFQVLLQAGTAVLGNANAIPQLALSLLQG